jgi:hypothetical protein
MDKKAYKRLQFDFSVDAVERLDEMVQDTNSSSRAELVRNSLRCYEFLFKKIQEGYELKLEKGSEKVTVMLLNLQ